MLQTAMYRYPNSLTSINLRAFEGCSSLASIHLPEGLTGIGELAFSGVMRSLIYPSLTALK